MASDGILSAGAIYSVQVHVAFSNLSICVATMRLTGSRPAPRRAREENQGT